MNYSLLKKPAIMELPKKLIKIISWTVCFSLILLLLAGGVMAYGIPYQGLDMPIRIHSHEGINWSEVIKEENHFFLQKEISKLRDRIIILKWHLGFQKQAVIIGRGPPSYVLNL